MCGVGVGELVWERLWLGRVWVGKGGVGVLVRGGCGCGCVGAWVRGLGGWVGAWLGGYVGVGVGVLMGGWARGWM